MTENGANYETVEPEILDNIKSFSGDPKEMSLTESVLNQGQTLQRTQTAYTTAVAVQKPRSFTRFVNNCMEEAKLAGSAFYYRWEVYDKNKDRKVPIEGESIDMSMCLARNFGNDVVDVDVTETTTHYLFKGVFIDLETGFTAPRLFRQRKGQKISGKMDADRQEDITFQIGQSKAIRNAIVRAMPKWLRDQMIDAAKDAELGKIKPENIHASRAKVMDFFFQYGITQDRIESERKKIADDWGPQDIVDLRGMATALKEGRISPDELFPVENPEGKPVNANGITSDGTKSTNEEEKPLFDRLKAARSTFLEMVRDNVSKICNEGTAEQIAYLVTKWENKAPGVPCPLSPVFDKEGPNQDEAGTSAPDEGESTDTDFDRAMKGYQAELGPPRFNRVLGRHDLKYFSEVKPEQQEMIMKAMSSELDQAAKE